MDKINKISVFGLGKLGVPFIAALISKGFCVQGVDLDIIKVNSLKSLKSPVYEDRVQDLLDLHGKNLDALSDGIQAVKESDISFVVVATPSDTNGAFSNEYILNVCEKIGVGLKEKNQFHLVVITSTIMPGSIDNVIKPQLEKISGKKAGKDFGLCYNPEFIALGTVIKDLLNPDFVLIGESDKISGDVLEKFYSKFCDNKPPMSRMNFINAELAKISLNTFITTKISFANMLARICEKLPGTNVDVVTEAIGLDSRVGKKYLKGAVSYGGPCFPRDNLALNRLTKLVNAPSDIAKATDDFNRSQIKWLANLVVSNISKGDVVGIFGVTYKKESNVIENAAGFLLAKELIEQGVNVLLYDPVGLESAKTVLQESARYVADMKEAVCASNILVVVNPLEKISDFPELIGADKKVVIDCWRILISLQDKPNVKYVPLGIGMLS